ncbi:hypothetical protein BVRB_2g047260 [Beta vulgaris subsp. vulgaris]|uniref:Uncharacterized protein n=1 Tax=Beta vulgaris subsp. vulgaris TaxID=3555 RepID=A0A0J8BGJ0_BETVV|nr:hypothetical protein BVRB_2g047260 [Beta vulgaris subsp. vulgaris]
MSTPADVYEDSRYKTDELPAHLGKDPSKETLQSWYSNFGWVWLCQITNNSSNTIKFYNPWYDVNGEIAPGKTESYNSKGYFPLWSYSKRYEITYYNQAFKEWKKMTIKDLDGNWWLSFEQDAVDEDIRAVRPPAIVTVSGINLTITESGYEIYSVSCGKLHSRLSFQAPSDY